MAGLTKPMETNAKVSQPITRLDRGHAHGDASHVDGAERGAPLVQTHKAGARVLTAVIQRETVLSSVRATQVGKQKGKERDPPRFVKQLARWIRGGHSKGAVASQIQGRQGLGFADLLAQGDVGRRLHEGYRGHATI